jgi:biopolymer transport protein ExbB
VESLLPFIAVTAAASPLLGLLGTVTGMIHTFELINLFGTGDPRRLASGISEALITTEFGLFVAIPALLAHALLARRAQSILARMEKLGVAFVNAWEEHRGKGDAA